MDHILNDYIQKIITITIIIRYRHHYHRRTFKFTIEP